MKESGEGKGGYGKEMSKAFLDAEFALFRKQAAVRYFSVLWLSSEGAHIACECVCITHRPFFAVRSKKLPIPKAAPGTIMTEELLCAEHREPLYFLLFVCDCVDNGSSFNQEYPN